MLVVEVVALLLLLRASAQSVQLNEWTSSSLPTDYRFDRSFHAAAPLQSSMFAALAFKLAEMYLSPCQHWLGYESQQRLLNIYIRCYLFVY